MPPRYSFLCVLAIPFSLICAVQGQEFKNPLADVKPSNLDAKKESLDQKKTDKVAFAIRYLDKKDGDWQVAESANFRIFHNQDKDVVEKVAQAAQKTRLALQHKWFGNETKEWDGKCSIYLHADREKYAAKAGSKNTVGHMRSLVLGSQLFSRTIHVPCKEPQMLEDILPHEVSHAVMAARFQGKLPRWAEEGMAMLAETPPAVKECLGRLPKYKKQDDLFSLEVLMQTDVNDHFNTLEFYSQSTSLVQFLTERKGPNNFIAFLTSSLRKGYEPALKEHFAIQSFRDLENQWQAFAFKEAKKKK